MSVMIGMICGIAVAAFGSAFVVIELCSIKSKRVEHYITSKVH
ncbi:MAG: hypothetical protein ACI4A3_03915 [Lachnospiraceae bacterium]